MNKTVLAALVSAAGLATSAYGQVNGTFQIEVRLVVDGSADAPTGAGIQSFLPGPQATRVGLTLQARMVQLTSGSNSGSGNYGIGGVLATGAGPAKLSHNDSTFSGGSYLALKRGTTSATLGTDGNARAGFFDGTNNPADFAGGRNFRFQNINTGAAADVNTDTGNAAGATGSNGASANGFFNGTSAGGIGGLSSTVQALGSAADPTKYATGTFSPWYNLYRAYFDPQPNASDPVRNVTVSFIGRISGIQRSVPSTAGSGVSLSIGGGSGAQLDVLAAAPVTATFQVPTPGAMALLGLGGLAAARRRRA